MSRLFLSAVVVMLLWQAGQPGAQAPNVVTTETTVKATVDRIERSIRVVTLRQEGNVFQSVYVDPKVKEFDDLKVGDAVTVTVIGKPKRTAVSISIPFKPKAPSPAISNTRRSGWSSLEAMAKDGPTPRQPNGPGSSHCPGSVTGTNFEAQPTTSPPSPTTIVSGVITDAMSRAQR